MKTFVSAAILCCAIFSGYVIANAKTQTVRVPQFDNDKVKVWKSIVQPDTPLALHRHDHPRVIVALQGGTMKIEENNGESETHNWVAGNAYWLPANRTGLLHTDENVSKEPIEVMVIELLNEK
ncbi:quercetin dioxygenase-like cupin family protein [Oxalobacteraceae bacterium GrIS 2.11]